MFLTRISVNHPVFATMVMVALLVFGVYSYQRLPVEQLPNVDLPVVVVLTTYAGATPEAVENDITKPVEEAVNTVSGIDTVQSRSYPSQSVVIVIFDMDVPSSVAAQDVRDKIAAIEATLPDNSDKPQVLRFDPAELPVVSLAISSTSMSKRDLTTLTEDTIVKRLQIIPGVGSATVVGGQARQVDILVDPDRLRALDIGMVEIMTALQQDNRDLPAGSVTQGSRIQSIQVEGTIAQTIDFLDIIVARRGGQPVRLGDVATIQDGQADIDSMALLNGQPALAIDIVKIQGANTVGVAHDIKVALDDLQQRELPDDVAIEIVRDNSVPVEQSFHSVQNTIVEGALLAVVIVFLFLNSWRSTVITGLTLPISIIGTLTALYFLGFTLNLMTLMALSLSVGILIDDAIVVRENITRHLHMGKSHRQAALDGTNEIGLAVLATTLSIVAVFLPVAFMEGIIGRFFLQFGVTVSVAVLISLFVSFTLDPMLSSVWYDPASEPNAKRGPIGRTVALFDHGFEWLSHRYRGVIRWALKWRKTTLAGALAVFIGSLFLFPLVGVEFVPPSDTGELQIDIETPVGSSIEYTASKVRQIDRLLHDTFPEVERTYATLNSGSSMGDNRGSILVTLVDRVDRDRSPLQLTQPIRQALTQIPGVTANIGAAGGLGGVTKPIQVNIYGEDLGTLERLSNQVMARMEEIPGIADVETSLLQAQPVLGIRINREAASDLGISLQQISSTLDPMLGGEKVSDWTAPNGQTYDVVIRLPEDARNEIETLGALPIAQSGSTGSSSVVRLDQVADLVESVGPGEIIREDLTRQVSVSANISEGALGELTTRVQAAVEQIQLPAGYRISLGGDSESLGDTAVSAGTALLMAIIFIYLVLASQFGSFIQPFAIMMSLPLSLVGVLLGLLIAGSTLNMMSAIGFIMLMGLVVKNAILLVDNANQHVRQGWNLYDALVEAGGTRFRPIVMTTLAMVFGMLPLALAIHEGSEQSAPMAHAVIGGLISSTILTLVVVPVILTYLEQFSHFVGRILPKAPTDHEAHEPAE